MTKMLNDNSIDYFPPDVATKPASWDSSEDRPATMKKWDDEDDGDNEDDGCIIVGGAIATGVVVLFVIVFFLLKLLEAL